MSNTITLELNGYDATELAIALGELACTAEIDERTQAAVQLHKLSASVWEKLGVTSEVTRHRKLAYAIFMSQFEAQDEEAA